MTTFGAAVLGFLDKWGLALAIFIYFSLKDWLVTERIMTALKETNGIINKMVDHCVVRQKREGP